MIFNSDLDNQCTYCFENSIFVDYSESRAICKACGTTQDLLLFDTYVNEQSDVLTDDIQTLVDDYLCNFTLVDSKDPPSAATSASALKLRKNKRLGDSKPTSKSHMNVMYEQLSNLSFDIPSNIKKQCIALVSKIFSNVRYKGENANALLVAALYYSYRSENIERSVEDLCSHFNVNKQKVLQQLKTIESTFNMTELQGRNAFTLLNTYISKLSVLDETSQKQLRIKIQKYLMAHEDILEGRTSKSVVLSYMTYLLETDEAFKDKLDTTSYPNMSINSIISKLFNISQATLVKSKKLYH